MKVSKKLIFLIFVANLLLDISIMHAQVANASVMSQQSGQIAWYTTAPKAINAGNRFSTVGWSFYVSNGYSVGSCYISLNEMQYNDAGTQVFYSISIKDIQQRTGVDLSIGNIFVYANARVNFHYTNSSGQWTIVYGEANNKVEADALSNQCMGHDFEGSNYFYQAVAWNHFYLTVKCGTGVSKTYGSGWYEKYSNASYGALEYSEGYCNAKEEKIYMDGNKTVYVNAEKKKYTIDFDANGGKNPPDSLIKTYGDDINIPTKVPIKEYYDFIAWNTCRDGSGEWYKPGSVFRENSNIILYAKWKPALYWQTTLSKINGETILGIGANYKDSASLQNMYSNMQKAFDNAFAIKKVSSLTGLSYISGGDMTGFIYVNIDSGNVNKIKYDFCDELNEAGLNDVERLITPTGALGAGSDFLCITIPETIPNDKIYTITITATTTADINGPIIRHQVLRFSKKEVDLSQIRDRIRYQGGMYK